MAATVLPHNTVASIHPFFHPGTYAARTNRTAIRSQPQPHAGFSAASSFVTPVPTMSRKQPVPFLLRRPGTYATRASGNSVPPTLDPTTRSAGEVSSTPHATTVPNLTQQHVGAYSNRTIDSSVASTTESVALSPKTVHGTAGVLNPTQPPSTAPRSRFSNRTRSVYLGTSSIIIIPTTRTPVVAVRAVLKDTSVPESVPEPTHLPAAPPLRFSQCTNALLRRTQSTGSFIQRATTPHEEPGDDTVPLLGTHRWRPSESPYASDSLCIRCGATPASKLGSHSFSVPETKSGRERPVSRYFYNVDEEDAELEEMPEVREALHVNAHICAMGYRYERVLEVAA